MTNDKEPLVIGGLGLTRAPLAQTRLPDAHDVIMIDHEHHPDHGLLIQDHYIPVVDATPIPAQDERATAQGWEPIRVPSLAHGMALAAMHYRWNGRSQGDQRRIKEKRLRAKAERERKKKHQRRSR